MINSTENTIMVQTSPIMNNNDNKQTEVSKTTATITNYEDVKNQTTEQYFNGNKFSIDAFEKKYALHDKETYVQAIKRVCDAIASVEKTDELKEYWSKRWFNEIYNDEWHPAGSIMQGANSGRNISTMNCTTIALPEDSLEGILRYNLYNVAKCAAYRQGLGVDFSKIRPKSMNVYNSSNKSQGVIHWMKLVDNLAYYIGQCGRIPAELHSLNISHPDIEEFITVKSDRTKIQNANISIQITNDFYRQVLNDGDWELKFVIPEIKKGQKVYLDARYHDILLADGKDETGNYTISKRNRPKEVISKIVKAKKLLELIAKSMHSNAEPGIQNIDIARKFSNSDAVDWPILSTNACCVVGYTKILTNKGWKTIKEIVDIVNNKTEDILVMSYNIEKQVYELKEVLHGWQQRNDSTVTLTLEENGKTYEIECSGDHKIFTKNRGYVRADSLTNDDDILIFA